ncbi:MAG: iron-sulfur cluster assembly protein [Amaricoccus sp.]
MRAMPEARDTGAREADVRRVLARVADPELDEPITAMGFVEEIGFDGDVVTVRFRLPTYWCSPNFAFLMAEGIVREVSSLPWVARVLVRLEDHMHADEVNAAVNDGRSFSDAFAALCDGADLGELQAKFDEKAFQRRQESVLLRLRALGWSDGDIVAMTVRQLDAVDFEGGEAEGQRPRYREALARRGLARWPGDLAFRTWQGEPIAADGLRAHLSVLRQVRISMEFNGALCRGLQGARYKEVAEIDGEPTLVDFMLGRMPRQRARQTSVSPG